MIGLALVACGGGEAADPLQGEVPLADATLRLLGTAFDAELGAGRLGTVAVAVGDLDGDGLLDLAGTDGDAVRVGLQGDGRFVSTVLNEHLPVGMTIVDRTGDAASELVLGRYASPPDDSDATTVEAATVVSVAVWPRTTTQRIFYAGIGDGRQGLDFGVHRLPDLDDDGHPELAVHNDRVGPEPDGGTVWLLQRDPGEELALDEAALGRLYGVAGARAGGPITAGDLDGDGRMELVVGVAEAEGLGAVIVPGPFTVDLRLDPVRSPSVSRVAATGFATGDLDGDGRDDLLCASPDGALAFAGPAPENGGPEHAFATLRAPRAGPVRSVDVAEDLDGDGHDDLLAGAPDGVREGDGGVAAILYGPVAGSRAFDQADARLVGEGPGERAGWFVQGPGDADGDGYGDVVVGAPLHDLGRGAIYVLPGGPRD